MEIDSGANVLLSFLIFAPHRNLSKKNGRRAPPVSAITNALSVF
ncbi:hypothetical protein B4113_0756 [Geobacillus sp. B4113_201601]|nr:hypothetical protein B4113_0756 [Geobacillus sp. B4113_201601]